MFNALGRIYEKGTIKKKNYYAFIRTARWSPVVTADGPIKMNATCATEMKIILWI